MIYTSTEQITISGCEVSSKAQIAYVLYKYRANRYPGLCSEGSYQGTDALVV